MRDKEKTDGQKAIKLLTTREDLSEWTLLSFVLRRSGLNCFIGVYYMYLYREKRCKSESTWYGSESKKAD
jgi:hypothetical protein